MTSEHRSLSNLHRHRLDRGGSTALLVVAGMTLIGCPSVYPARTPEETLRSFAQALRDGNPDAAYDLTSPTFRRRMSRQAFSEHVRSHPDEVAEVAARLSARPRAVEEDALVDLAPGETIELSLGERGWQVTSDVVDYYSQSSPRLALRTLVRAADHDRWDVLLRLVPEEDRDGISEESLRQRWRETEREEAERMVQGIRSALESNTPIEEHGDHAVMPWGTAQRAELVRQNGSWCIEDPD